MVAAKTLQIYFLYNYIVNAGKNLQKEGTVSGKFMRDFDEKSGEKTKDYETQVYHVFKVRIGGKFYRDSTIYTDEEFERVMGLIGWQMPFNLSAYHFQSAKHPPQLNNSVMQDLPVVDLPIEELFADKPRSRMKLKDPIRRSCQKIYKKSGYYMLVEDGYPDSPYGRLIWLGDGATKIVADLYSYPITLKRAKEFVDEHHRHCLPPQGHKFSICLMAQGEEEPVGVVIASVPKARKAADPYTLEINRCCTNERYHNVCSQLYALAVRAGRAMGYRKFITYTLPSESGCSLRAVGFTPAGIVPASPRGWASPSRPRKLAGKYPTGEKQKWILDAA